MEIKSIITKDLDICYVCGRPRQTIYEDKLWMKNYL